MMDSDLISHYINKLFVTQDQVLIDVQKGITEKGLPEISIRPEEGRFLQFLVRACGAKKAVEIGTFAGYSGIWIARGLLPGGKLITIERDAYHARVAQEHIQLAGVAEKVEVRLGDAKSTLIEISPLAPFDFIFIDADKPNYLHFFEWAVEHLRPGGVIAAHNALRSGQVADPDNKDETVEIIRAFNAQIAVNNQVISTIYPGGDGILVAVKVA